MIFLFKQPGLAFIRRNQKYIVVGSIPSLPQRRMVSPAAVVAATMSASDSILPARSPSGTTGQGSPASRQKAPGVVARAFLSENHPLDEWGLVGVWNEGEGGEWLRDNQGGALPRGY